MTTVSVGIVTHNTCHYMESCLRAVMAQTHPPVEIWISDSGSTDGTLDWLAQNTPDLGVISHDNNVGFGKGHNAAIAASRGEYYLALNPDAVLEPDYVRCLLEAVDTDPTIGMAQGKLIEPPLLGQPGPPLVDSAGIVMKRDRRLQHRGYGQADEGQWDEVMPVFAVDGAAPLYRRAMLEDIRFEEEYFDAEFFMYREEIDLSWRAQWRGWRGLYVPQAVAFHRRTYNPETRSRQPAVMRRCQFRNRLLMMIKNDTLGTLFWHWPFVLWFELRALVYLLLFERDLLPAYRSFVNLLPAVRHKRRWVMSRRTVDDADIRRWFR